jgi:hypothetical protein
MRPMTRTMLIGVFNFLVAQVIGVSAAHAQGSDARGSLGGYGGSMSNLDSGMGMGGSVIPYAGKFGGFMPYRMSGSSSLSFQSRGTSALGSMRTSFSLSPMSGGMSSMSGGTSPGFGAGGLSSFGSQGAMGSGTGLGLGGSGMQSMSRASGMSVMPPSFAYPFRQPPSLLTPASAGTGMSM